MEALERKYVEMPKTEPIVSPYNGWECFINKKGVLEYTPDSIRKLNHFYRDVWYRLHNRDQNYLMVITGKVGTGKSFASVRMATQIDPNFDVNKQVVFTPDQFMGLVRDKTLHDGAVVIWEEVGVNYSSKSWYEVINKQVGYVLQTFRKKHICLIMTVPNKDFLDSTARKLVDAEGRMLKIDRDKKVSKMRVYLPNYESNTRKWYHKKPRIQLFKTGERFQVKHINMPKVDIKTAHAYEKKRAEYIESLGEAVENELKSVGNKLQKKLSTEQIVKEVIDNNAKFRSLKGVIDATKIQYEFGVSRQKAYDAKHLVETLLSER